LKEDAETAEYADPSRIKTVHHHGDNFHLDGVHILDPSPQRTPFLFQAGTSPAGIAFGTAHAEGIFVSAISPEALAPRVKTIREEAAKRGRDPTSIKIFPLLTPIIGRTEEEAKEKYEEALKHANFEAGLTFWSGSSGIDLSQFDLDQEIRPTDVTVDARVHSTLTHLQHTSPDIPAWTPRNIGKWIALGANGPLSVGTPEKIADLLERWVDVADVDGFNIGYIISPGSFEDVVELLVPELKRRGLYDPLPERSTLRERIYGVGQKGLRDDHLGSRYRFDVYDGN
jgi:alkanesulfonate monooxygenase SsuD/methylene tetrahydromethanopterin reductase-like flavin-dependent oxidoreductase (luciferase family)